MQETFHQYNLMTELTKKYSHSTYLASPINEPERQVVLTVFNASLFRLSHEREKLLLQAQRLKEFEHPHLMPILDIGVEKEQPFVVRKYLPNGSLRSRLKQLSPHHLELSEALTIVSQVGLALTYAHEHLVLHGNIKPENILFKANGQAVLTDFHLVSRRDDIICDQSTEEYAFCYMAPEQWAGICDARSDQYALGCLAYELITGRIPFSVQSLTSMMGQPNHAPPAPLSESVADLSPSLEAAVLKTLAKDPDERFFDFSLFLEVIQSVLAPPPAFPLGNSTRSRKKSTLSHPMYSAQAEAIPPHPIRSAQAEAIPPHPIRSAQAEDIPPHPMRSAQVQETPPHPMHSAQVQETPFHPLHSAQVQETPSLTIKEETNDWLRTTVFGGEETNASLVKAPVSVYEWGESGTDSMMLSLPGNMPLIRLTQHHRKSFYAFMLLIVAIVALITYNFWPFQITQPSTISRSVQKGTQVTFPQMPPLQVPNASLMQTPAQATNTPTVYPSAEVKTIPKAQLSPLTATPSPTPIMSYEAEASQNTLAGGAAVVSCPGCSGGKRVEQIGRGGTLQFNDVNKSSTDQYNLTIYYTNGSNERTFYMSVNSGSSIALIAPATGTWHTVGTLSVTVNLNAGKNTLLFFNSSARGPDIDKIVV